MKSGSWHTIKTVVTGTKASVYLDGQSQPVLSFDFSGVQGFAGAIATGSVGFGNQQGADARFRNLSVVSSADQTLYASTLTGFNVLDDFAAGVNRLPTIMDGPKRDRYVWSGDIGISGLSILYDSGAGEYIAGAVRLHGDYATPNGEAAGFLPPQLIPRAKPSDNNFSGYTFTTDYSNRGPRRLPLGQRSGFATRGRKANSRAATRDCGQRTTAAALRSCAAVSGAQYLLHVKTAIINGRLDRYTGHHSAPADMAV